MKAIFYAYIAIVVVMSACSSGKSTFERGNYYEAVLTSVNRLRKNSDHKKSVETLRQAYPMALAFYEDKARTALASSKPFKWTEVVNAYTTINHMYDEIKRCPGALKVVPAPANYSAKLHEARTNAAEEHYAAGIVALQFGNREKAREAYGYFKTAHGYMPGYKEVIDYMAAALDAATLKILVEPIPVQSKTVGVSAEFFNDKISEFVHTAAINEFVRFYTLKEAETIKLNPDHIIQLQFDDFTVGQVYKHEKEIHLTKDSVVMATYVTPSTAQAQPSSGGASPTTGSGLAPARSAVVASAQVPVSTQPSGQQVSGETAAERLAREQAEKARAARALAEAEQAKAQQEAAEKARLAREAAAQREAAEQARIDQEAAAREAAEKAREAAEKARAEKERADAEAAAARERAEREAANKPAANADPTINSADTMNVKDPVTICHVPPGNNAQRRTLVISRSALEAHLKHGDVEGDCHAGHKPPQVKPAPAKEKAEDVKGKPAEIEKGKPQNPGKGKGPGADLQPIQDSEKHAALYTGNLLVLAAAGDDPHDWLRYLPTAELDTNKVYGTVKAVLYHHTKKTTASGVVSFRIIDARTGALLSAEKMPGEFVWVSEWATFNGDERALSPEQLKLTRLKEQPAPAPQDLFIEFTRPIYQQITTKINEFYKGK